MHIREATESDLSAVLDIYNHAILHTTAVWSLIPVTLDDRQEWFRVRQAAGFPILVAIDGDAICGFCSYGPFRPWAGFAQTVEHSVYVAEGQRRKGVARKLMAALIVCARDRGIHVMVGGVDASNEVSCNLHLAMGFTDAGTLRQVGRKFDRWLDLTFFTLALDTHHEC